MLAQYICCSSLSHLNHLRIFFWKTWNWLENLCPFCLLLTPVKEGNSFSSNKNNNHSRLKYFLLFSCVWVFVTPWTAARQASLSIAISQSLLKLMSIESVIPSNHFILCHPLLLLSSTFPSMNELLETYLKSRIHNDF